MSELVRDIVWAVVVGAASLLAGVIVTALREHRDAATLFLVFFGANCVAAAWQIRKRRWRRAIFTVAFPLVFFVIAMLNLGIA
jgi:drug/metabolite transporter (DMT)-like permease